MAEKITLKIEIGSDGKTTIDGPLGNGPMFFWLLQLAEKMFWDKRNEDALKKAAPNIVIPNVIPGPFTKQ